MWKPASSPLPLARDGPGGENSALMSEGRCHGADVDAEQRICV